MRLSSAAKGCIPRTGRQRRESGGDGYCGVFFVFVQLASCAVLRDLAVCEECAVVSVGVV